MPKLALSRRHQRQRNLLEVPDTSESTFPNTPRKISEESIHHTISVASTSPVASIADDCSNSSCTSSVEFQQAPGDASDYCSDSASNSPPVLETESNLSRQSLKRPIHSVCLVDMMDTHDNDAWNHTPTAIPVSPSLGAKPVAAPEEPVSPLWGHFVELFNAPTRDNADESGEFGIHTPRFCHPQCKLQLVHSNSPYNSSNSTKHSRFMLGSASQGPYPLKRRRKMSGNAGSSLMDEFMLGGPTSFQSRNLKHSSSTQRIQDALQGLQM